MGYGIVPLEHGWLLGFRDFSLNLKALWMSDAFRDGERAQRFRPSGLGFRVFRVLGFRKIGGPYPRLNRWGFDKLPGMEFVTISELSSNIRVVLKIMTTHILHLLRV